MSFVAAARADELVDTSGPTVAAAAGGMYLTRGLEKVMVQSGKPVRLILAPTI